MKCHEDRPDVDIGIYGYAQMKRPRIRLIFGFALALGLCSNAAGVDITTTNKLISRTDTARADYLEMQQDFERQPGDRTQERIKAAKETYEQRSSELSRARVETLAEYSGIAPQEIEKRRAAAATWTAISREISVHPSIIGIELIDAQPPPFAGGQ